MQDPIVRHIYVKIHRSFVHLAQYGHGENIIIRSARSSPSSSFVSNHGDSHQQSLSNTSTSSISGQPKPSSSSMSLLADRNRLSKLIIFVPGNPGVLGVYHDFLVTLYRTLNKPSNKGDNPVILAMSHNNFDHPDHCDYRADERICIEESELSFVEKTKLDAYKDPHEIELQVMNKLIILKRLLKLDLRRANENACKLVFVGHSIGCYVLLRLLQDRTLAKFHAGSILVHPALENLATTEKGAAISRYFAFKLDYVMHLMAYVMEKVLPKWAKLNITKWLCSPELVESSSNTVLESIAQMASPLTLTAIIEMAKSELANVKGLDHETMIKPHASKLKLIYTIGDHWVNGANRLELSERYPELHIEEQQTLHAFVMDPNVVTNYAIKIGIFIQDIFE